MKPLRNILGITGNIRGDYYPQTLRNSMKPFGNILGITGNIRGDDYPQAFGNSMKAGSCAESEASAVL